MRSRGLGRARVGVVIGAVLAIAAMWTPVVRAVDTDMAIDTTAIDFGDVLVGEMPSQAVTLTNTGGDPFGPINLFGGAPPTAEFGASQNCQGTVLPAGGSCTIRYSFSPGSVGTFSDQSNFTISETASQNDGEAFSVALAGRGVIPSVPTLAASTTNLDFGETAIGSSRFLVIVITNTGTDPLTPAWTGIDPSDLMNFSGSTDCTGVTLAPGSTCQLEYEFHPVAIGPVHAVTNVGTGLGFPMLEFPIELRGTGVAAAPTPTPTPRPTATPTPSPTPTSTASAAPSAGPPASPSSSASAAVGASAGASVSPSLPSLAPQTAASTDAPGVVLPIIVLLVLAVAGAAAAGLYWRRSARRPDG